MYSRFLIIFLFLILNGCGQSGPLVLIPQPKVLATIQSVN